MSKSIDMGKLLGSDSKLELLMLFHNNPGLMDARDGVARRIGKTGPEIEADLKDLLSIGILVPRKIGTSEVISLNRNRDNEIQEIIANRVKSEDS